MKKLITLLLALSLVLTACGPSISYELSEEKIAEYEEMLEQNKAKLKEDGITNGDYNTALKEIAVAYQRLGKTQKAIKSYKQLLERHETNYTALTNLTSIYQELQDWDNATLYALELMNYYGNKEATVDKVIRIHVEAGKYEEALALLEMFASKYQSQENMHFISDTYEFIGRVRMKNEQ